ncbi:MAG TPA: hypothetical protein VM597_31110 [Gemmataceae bacterium]|jgi:hypothetical protein|nr:hypothetical protein [Gemmataceae bacterium]
MRTLLSAAAAVALLGAVGCGESDTRPTVASNRPVLESIKAGGKGGGETAPLPAVKGAGRSAPVGGQGLKGQALK